MIIYTANYGGYDPPVKGAGLYFTDQQAPDGWEDRTFSAPWFDVLPDVGKAKALKIFPWLVLGDDWHDCLWVDANIEWRGGQFPDTDFATLEQTSTKSIWREFSRLDSNMERKYGLSLKGSYKQQKAHYEDYGMQEHDGNSCRTCVVYRRNTPRVRWICHAWLDEFLSWQNWRDQPALRFVLWQMREHVRLIPQAVGSRWQGLDFVLHKHAYGAYSGYENINV